jgi:hypothetical protein
VVQIRQSLDPQAANVQSVMSPHNVSEITWRDSPPTIDNAGNQAPSLTGATERATGTGPIPGWIRLVRSGNTFTSYWAVDNNGTPGPWQGALSHNTTMSGDVYVGIGLSAHANGKVATAVFDHVTVTGFTPRTISPDAVVTPAANSQAGSIFANKKVDVSNFTTTFTFQMRAGSNPIADGMTITIQNAPSGSEISESVLKLSTTGPGTSLPLLDYFTPHDWKLLDNQDADLGSGGTLLIPDAVSGGKHLIVETGKTGRLYLVNRDNLGKFNTRYDHIEEIITLAGANTTPGVWGNPAFLQDGPNTGLLFYWGSSSPGQAFRITNGVISPVPASQTAVSFGFPGSQPSISSSGTDGSTAIMWALRPDNYGSAGPERLYAYSAEDLTKLLWKSDDVTGRDEIGGSSVKFTFPIVANGHVYAGSNGSLAVYGLLAPHTTAPAAPSALAGMGASPTQIQLTWTSPAPNDATLIKIERSTAGPNGPWTQIAQVGPDQTMFADTGLTPVTPYWYRIRATNQAGDSAYSNTATATTRVPAPVLTVLDICPLAIQVGWTATVNDHYLLERSTDAVNFTVVADNIPAGTTTYTDTGLAQGTYFYRVTGFNVNPDDQATSAAVQATIGPVSDIDHSLAAGGFANHSDLQASGSALFSEAEQLLRLTNNSGQTASAFTVQRMGYRGGFTTTFTVRLHEGTQPDIGDGFTFTLQEIGPSALANTVGSTDGRLGYQGIGNSVAIKFDVRNNEGETDNSTGLFFNGGFPGLPHQDGEVNKPLDPMNVNLRSQSTKTITLTYDGVNHVLTETIHDPTPGQTNNGDFTTTYNVDIASKLGGDTAFVGFTGGTGGAVYSLQDILSWTYNQGPENDLPPQAPTNLRATTVPAPPATATEVDLAWNCNNSYTAQNFVIERSTNPTSGFAPIMTVDVNTNTFIDKPAQAGVYYYRVRATIGPVSSNFSNTFPVYFNVTPAFQGKDIGSVATAGSFSYAPNGVYTVQASGDDIFGQADAFHYVYLPLNGDGQIIARLTSIDPTNSVSDFVKAGVMIRETLAPDAREVSLVQSRDHSFRFQRRFNPGESTDRGPDSQLQSILTPPLWIRLQRKGNVFSAYYHPDGVSTWTPAGVPGEVTVNMASNVFIGLALTAHNNNGQLATATFDNVTVIPG